MAPFPKVMLRVRFGGQQVFCLQERGVHSAELFISIVN